MKFKLEILRLATLAIALVGAITGANAQDGFAGLQPDVVLRDSGLPLIAYATNNGLHLLSCGDIDCHAANMSGKLDDLSPEQPRIALRNDGRPLIAYRGGAENGLRVYDCADTDCTTGTIRPLDPVPAAGIGIAIRPNGNPLIVYGDTTPSVRAMKVYDCDDPNCASGTARIPTGLLGFNEGGTAFTDNRGSVTMRSNGLAVVSGERTNSTIGSDNGLLVYDCTDSGCSTGNVTTYEDNSSTRSEIRSDDTPFIAFAASGLLLKGLSCNDSGCATAANTDTLDTSVRLELDVAMRTADLPIFSYVGGGDLKAYDCDNPACSSGTINVLDSVSSFINHPSMVIRPDGTPLIAYTASPNIRIVSCDDAACSSSSSGLILLDDLFSDGFEG